jgi:tRNA nucleotidyltransferase (CCA-adding enzyme)
MPASTLDEGAAARGEDGRAVLAGLSAVPGGPELLRAVAGREDAELIGGATRDLLLGRAPLELDVVVAEGAETLARELALAVSAPARASADASVVHGAHDRFETAFLTWEGGRIDITTRRAESYPAPGALPHVRPGGPEEDLARRDFTVNAIAVALAGERAGELRAAPHALEDLHAKRLRILHARSFLDDPTRLLRLARYRARLGFEIEATTAQLADDAVRERALDTVSRARVGAELRLALAEADAVAALASLERLGVLAALALPLTFDERLARSALAVLPAGGRADLLLLASLLVANDEAGAGRERRRFLDELEFTAAERDCAAAAATHARELRARLAGAGSPSAIRDAVRHASLEAIALAAALDSQEPSAPAARAARQWLEELRHVRLQITGHDLLAAGLPSGPEIGQRLGAVLDMRLDGKVGETREEQLAAALGATSGARASGR